MPRYANGRRFAPPEDALQKRGAIGQLRGTLEQFKIGASWQQAQLAVPLTGWLTSAIIDEIIEEIQP